MVRAPCCEKKGLKKGPWTQEEDVILVSYIQRHGHDNWRALPKLAGLLRCGKSCRLRWTNYLRPDIKRGNYSKYEEEMIISLHQLLGNRWSAIAARLPGRTDNEIKNVWHTHLKKRLQPTHDQSTAEPKQRKARPESECKPEQYPMNTQAESTAGPSSSENSGMTGSCSRTDSSSFVTERTNNILSNFMNESMDFTSQEWLEIDEGFWNEALSTESCAAAHATAAQGDMHSGVGEQYLRLESLSSSHEDVNFWLRIFKAAQELPQL